MVSFDRFGDFVAYTQKDLPRVVNHLFEVRHAGRIVISGRLICWQTTVDIPCATATLEFQSPCLGGYRNKVRLPLNDPAWSITLENGVPIPKRPDVVEVKMLRTEAQAAVLALRGHRRLADVPSIKAARRAIESAL